ncbi:hypothetical protein J3R30DRAFT_3480951 [Lentinula aciculospora]|uniref:Uncharacterized protein n=1 Tax=Lentinula aciculospora TaxID=153920 RepID=A0A9W9AAN3_9AGAR|nr:hypothetical protein J3R30DRAFT_3480951 [Lentinula aciculospora]
MSSMILSLQDILGLGSLLQGLWILSPVILHRAISDATGNCLSPGNNIRYLFLLKYPECAFKTWATKYGSLFSIWMGT